MPLSSVLAARDNPTTFDQRVGLPAALLDRLRRRAAAVHAAGLKSYGLLVAQPGTPGFPYCATDIVFFDATKNRRNESWMRSAFEAQGAYFRAYDDAGFVADPAEVLRVHREIDELGLEAVAMFHSHRRQPANFSHIDFRLHSPAYPWHLIISLRDPGRPVLRAFAVQKGLDDFGIDPGDGNENSECAYSGPEVRDLPIASSM